MGRGGERIRFPPQVPPPQDPDKDPPSTHPVIEYGPHEVHGGEHWGMPRALAPGPGRQTGPRGEVDHAVLGGFEPEDQPSVEKQSISSIVPSIAPSIALGSVRFPGVSSRALWA